MAAKDEFDQVIDQNHQWLAEFIRGNVGSAKAMFSHREDVTLARPQPTAHRGALAIAHGWEQVAETLESAIQNFREGEVTSFESVAKYVGTELACSVEVERFNAKVGGREDITPYALRATMIFRVEEGAWKVVHRHADPITTAQPANSVIRK